MEFCWRVESTTGRVMEDSEWHHHCGGEWPERARVAAVALVAVARRGEGSLSIRLLTDIRTVFGTRDVMRTKDLMADLRRAQDEVRRSTAGALEKDMGALELDSATGVYRPAKRH